MATDCNILPGPNTLKTKITTYVYHVTRKLLLSMVSNRPNRHSLHIYIYNCFNLFLVLPTLFRFSIGFFIGKVYKDRLKPSESREHCHSLQLFLLTSLLINSLMILYKSWKKKCHLSYNFSNYLK